MRGCRSVGSLSKSKSKSKSKSGSGSGSIPVLIGTWTAQVMSHRNVPPLPLALLASWRLNSPAFTQPTDGIESKWTVYPAMASPLR